MKISVLYIKTTNESNDFQSGTWFSLFHPNADDDAHWQESERGIAEGPCLPSDPGFDLDCFYLVPRVQFINARNHR
jgi:hypothetical protein